MGRRTTVLVTGANRGIGSEIAARFGALGHHVVIGSRDRQRASTTAARVLAGGGEPTIVALDVADDHSVDAAAAIVTAEIGRLDVLVDNAAVDDDHGTAIAADVAPVRATMEVNLFGAWRVTQAVLPLLRASEHGRIVNVSSGAGSLAEMGGRVAAYNTAKVGLNAPTRMWAAELAAGRILVNSLCPRWVATDMGGAGGRPVADGAPGVVWAATLPDDGPTGGFSAIVNRSRREPRVVEACGRGVGAHRSVAVRRAAHQDPQQRSRRLPFGARQGQRSVGQAVDARRGR